MTNKIVIGPGARMLILSAATNPELTDAYLVYGRDGISSRGNKIGLQIKTPGGLWANTDIVPENTEWRLFISQVSSPVGVGISDQDG